ncbi:MCE family protein [Nocardioides sp. BGMRC 2183]|nr:MCE family protein [Nocardioides sp. BGMRC 2183]
MSARSRKGDIAVGFLAILLVLALLVAAYLAYHRALVPSEKVTLRTDVVGNQLTVGSDVKYNGVPVGRVDKIDASEEGATLSLALDPDTMDVVPADVVARLLPKTLFGERYVQLVATGSTDGATLEAGAVIHEDASAEATELQQVLDELLPVLRAIQPEKLSAMMGELALMLQDNGDTLGDSMVVWQRYLKRLNPLVPQMTEDLERLGRVAQEWNIAAPDLLDALATMTTSADVLVDSQSTLREVYASVIGMADTTGSWVDRNHQNIVILSRESRAGLQAAAPYAAQFPCLFEAVANYKPLMEKALGKDTDEPGAHAIVQVIPVRTKYVAGKDDVRFTQGTPAPRCPYVTGQPGTRPVVDTTNTWPPAPEAGTAGDEPAAIGPPPGSTVDAHLVALSGLGDANSPAENRLIAELLASGHGMSPEEYPAWSSLLLGPTLRNTKVVLQ